MSKMRNFILIFCFIHAVYFLHAEERFPFLSSQDALVVGEYLSILEQEMQKLTEARAAVVETEAAHLFNAGRISSYLDMYAANPAWLESYALMAQKKIIPELTLKEQLYELQQQRFEHATQLAQDAYTVRSGENAQGQDERIHDIGKAFSVFLKARIGDAERTDLNRLEKQLIAIVAIHPDTPKYTLCSLCDGAENLSDEHYKQWLLSLAAASPKSIAESLPDLDGLQDPVFTALYTRFIKEYASRRLLRDIYQAAAALYWSVDSYAAYTMIQAQRMDAVNRFMRNLKAVESDHLNLYLSEDPVFRRAFVETLSILWIVNLYERERYIQDYKLDPALLDQTLRSLSSVRIYDTACSFELDTRDIVSEEEQSEVDQTRDQTDAKLVHRIKELNLLRSLEELSLLYEQDADPRDILRVFCKTASDPLFVSLLRQGKRYADLYNYVKELFDGKLLSLYQENTDLHIEILSDFPDIPLVFSASLTQSGPQSSLALPLDPEAAYQAMALPEILAETGYVIAVLPSFLQAQTPGHPELELGSSAVYGSEDSKWTENQLRLLCARNGIPAPLIMPSEQPYGHNEYHYRLLSQGALRLAEYARQP